MKPIKLIPIQDSSTDHTPKTNSTVKSFSVRTPVGGVKAIRSISPRSRNSKSPNKNPKIPKL